MKNIYIMLGVIIITACSYSVYSTGQTHLKTISIQTFDNNTVEHGLEEKVYNEISNHFIRDSRLNIVTQSPDCMLEGEILDYSNSIVRYTDEGAEEYEVKILFKITFEDLARNEILWQKQSLVISERYSATDPTSTYASEEQAQSAIILDLYEMMLRESLEQW